MRPSTKVLSRVATVAIVVASATAALAAPAQASASDCTVTPLGGVIGASPATVTCPAGAGTFTFRVKAVCADGYPTLHLFPANGPWTRASLTATTTSSVPCNGYVPGSGFVWSAQIEVA